MRAHHIVAEKEDLELIPRKQKQPKLPEDRVSFSEDALDGSKQPVGVGRIVVIVENPFDRSRFVHGSSEPSASVRTHQTA